MNLPAMFVRAMLGEAPRPGWALVQDFGKDGGSKVAAFAPDTPARQIGRHIEIRDRAGRDVYIRISLTGAHPGPGRRGGKEESAGLSVLPLDLDGVWGNHAAPRSDVPLWPDLNTAVRFIAELERRGISVTLIDTGGGAHGHVAVRELETCGPEMAETILHRWGLLVDTVAAEFGPWRPDRIYNSDRLLRPPGTVSKKYTPVRPVRLISTGAAIGGAELLPLLPDLPTPEPKSTRSTPPVRRVDGGRDAAEITARWSAATDWAELLEPAGWTCCGDDGHGERRWTRPGKTRGPSAQSHDDPPVLWVHSTSTELPPLTTLTKLRALAYLRFGGDERAAWHAIAPAGKTDTERLADWIARQPLVKAHAGFLKALRNLTGPNREADAAILADGARRAGLPDHIVRGAVERALKPVGATR